MHEDFGTLDFHWCCLGNSDKILGAEDFQILGDRGVFVPRNRKFGLPNVIFSNPRGIPFTSPQGFYYETCPGLN